MLFEGDSRRRTVFLLAAGVFLFFALLGGGQRDGGWDGSGIPSARLAILPRTTHYNSFSSPLLPQFAAAFLE